MMSAPRVAESPIVVVGPGRCGTSAVAGLLHHLGVFMGRRFYPAHGTNPYGHWEDLEFLEPNDNFVTRGTISEVEWRHAIRAVIAARVAMNRPWGWKDPRTSVLLRQYLELLPSARFIRCRRAREAIVDSYLRSYGWTEPRAQRLIETREEALDRHLPADATLVVDFDELRDRRAQWIEAIVHFVGLGDVSPRQLSSAIEFIRPPAPRA